MLPTTGERETDLYFDESRSLPSLKRGLTLATLKLSGKTGLSKHFCKSFVKTGSKTGFFFSSKSY